jgi:dTDP-4-amino-4,6-dideoxygalactose transaminase
VASEVLSLPIYPELTPAQMEAVATVVAGAARPGASTASKASTP